MKIWHAIVAFVLQSHNSQLKESPKEELRDLYRIKKLTSILDLQFVGI